MVKFKGTFFNCTEGQCPCVVQRSSAELTAPQVRAAPAETNLTLVTKPMELISSSVPRSCGYLPGGGKGGGRKPSGFGALHWLHSVLQAKFWFPQPGLGHCQSPARCWTFPPPDGFPREPRGPLGGKPPLSPPRPPMRPMGPPGPPGPPGPVVKKQQTTSLGTALCLCGLSLQLEDRPPDM